MHLGQRARDLLLGGRRRARRSRARSRARRRCSPRSAGERPRALLLTHIHFDHAGAAGALVRRWPDLPVYVHERGAPHLVDPAQARRQRRAGSTAATTAGAAVGRGRARSRRRTCTSSRAARRRSRALPRRVHARPRLPPRLLPARVDRHGAFVGDVAGVRIPPDAFTLAPTPPPDIDVEAWERSLDTIAGWEPRRSASPTSARSTTRPSSSSACARACTRRRELADAARRGRLRRGLLAAASTRAPARPPTRSSRRRRPTSSTWASSATDRRQGGYPRIDVRDDRASARPAVRAPAWTTTGA